MQNGTPVSEWDTDGPVSSSGGREVSGLGNLNSSAMHIIACPSLSTSVAR